MSMPDDIFQQYLEMLPLPYCDVVKVNLKMLELEKQKADILWELIPKYYTSASALTLPIKKLGE